MSRSRFTNGTLGESRRIRRTCRQSTSQFIDRCIKLVVGHDLRHQTDCERFGGFDNTRRHHHVGRAPESDESRQEIAGRHITASERQLYERRTESRVVRGDAEVAGHGQPETATEDVAMTTRDNGLAHP